MLETLLRGVSTREYEQVIPEMAETVGVSRSSVSREASQAAEAELERLFHKLPQLSDRARCEIRQSFDRLVGKLLHPPLESLRAESRDGVPNALLDAVDTLFQLKDKCA